MVDSARVLSICVGNSKYSLGDQALAIETICSGCSKRLSVPEEHAGKQARCPVCSQLYTVPYPREVSGSAVGRADENAMREAAQNAQGFGPPTRAEVFWMQANDGTVYGPAERSTLSRWFDEGRVGPGYKIREGEYGAWRDCEAYRPSSRAASFPSSASSPAGTSGSAWSANAAESVNPYAPQHPGGGMQQVQPVYAKADQGVLILAMGILGFIVCPICSLVAWVMGANALRDIRNGQMDPSGKGIAQAGYYLGIINCLFTLIWMVTALSLLVVIGASV